MSKQPSRRRLLGILTLGLGLAATAAVTFSAIPSASANSVIPVVVDGVFYKIQSSWTEQCSASLYVQTSPGPTWPSELSEDYTKIPRGTTRHVRPADNGGNDGDFYWRCGTTEERSDAPGNGFNLLRVKHSDTSREISMMALDKCGNGTSVDQCF